MSICSRSVGALSRSRLSPAKTLAPFLYQTATIQQWKPTCRSLPHRNASSRSRVEQDIPFENEIEPPPGQDATSARKSTITGSERAAFETLYKTFRTHKHPRNGSRSVEDEVADEYYEDDDEVAAGANAATLDSLFDAVLTNQPKGGPPRASRKKMEDMASLAEQILEPEVVAARNEQERLRAARAAKIQSLQSNERARIKGLLNAARTDRELWAVLEKEVFDVMKNLKLDEKETQIKKPRKKGAKLVTSGALAQPQRQPTKPIDLASGWMDIRDPAIFFPNFPLYILDATKFLIRDFPSSPLPFAVIPTLKSLGRSAYILGATASLYRTVLRATWLQQYSYSRMCSLLQDMSNSGVEPDITTLNLLDEILEEYRNGRRGRLGTGIHAVWQFKTISESARKLTAWRDGIAERLGVKGPRNGSPAIVRRYPPGKDKDTAHSVLSDTLATDRRPKSTNDKAVANSEHTPLAEGKAERNLGDGAASEEHPVLLEQSAENETTLTDRSSTVQAEDERNTIQHDFPSSHGDITGPPSSERQLDIEQKERTGGS